MPENPPVLPGGLVIVRPGEVAPLVLTLGWGGEADAGAHGGSAGGVRVWRADRATVAWIRSPWLASPCRALPCLAQPCDALTTEQYANPYAPRQSRGLRRFPAIVGDLWANVGDY